jgi:hypothetical protein
MRTVAVTSFVFAVTLAALAVVPACTRRPDASVEPGASHVAPVRVGTDPGGFGDGTSLAPRANCGFRPS